MQNPVSNPIENPAAEAGKLFALSEIDAARAFQLFATAIGETPDYNTWIANRTDWVANYIETKPNTLSNSADQAFNRFTKRLLENYPTIKQPEKSNNPVSVKKAAERAKKAEALLTKYQEKTAAEIADMRRAALEAAAKGSEAAEKVAAELKKVLKAKTSEADKAKTEALKNLREQVTAAAKKCADLDKLTAALDCLDDASEINFVIE